jgi:hypothetical protein
MRKREDAGAHEGGRVERGTSQIDKNLGRCRKVGREMDFRTESQLSTELPFTRGSFNASVRDHNLKEASHLYYEGNG